MEGPTKTVDPFVKLRASPLFDDSKKHDAPGWTTHDVVADPQFVKFADDPGGESDLRLSEGSPAIDARLAVPPTWLDPLAEADEGNPDIGAVPFGVQPWGVGIDGRIPLFGGTVNRR